MKNNHIVAKTKRKFKATTNSKHNYPVAESRLNQNFSADRPSQVWVADITYIPTNEGWLYLSAIEDLFDRNIVGWAMDSTMTRDLRSDAARLALATRGARFHVKGGHDWLTIICEIQRKSLFTVSIFLGQAQKAK